MNQTAAISQRTESYRVWALLIVSLLLMLMSPVRADAADTRKTAQALQLDVYVSETCPHCADAKRFLQQLMVASPDVSIRYHVMERDAGAAAELQRLSVHAGIWPPGVPTFVMGEHILVGFGPDSRRQLQQLLTGGELRSVTQPQVVDAGWLGILSVERLGLPLFTLALGLLDGFNPCAMWVLLFLLSMLIRLKDRGRMAWIAGTFVLVSALVYYAFMAAWLNLFMAIGLNDLVRIGLALLALLIGLVNVKDFVAFGKGISFSIPDRVKPTLYARMRSVLHAQSIVWSLVGVAMLALVVNFVEILCTAGLPAIYTAVLTQQGLAGSEYYAYLGLYILAYMADDSLMVAIAVMALNSQKLTETSGRRLKLLSGLIMLCLGLVMLLKPELLL